MAGVDVGGVELEFPCPHCGEPVRAAIEAVRMLPVLDCAACDTRFGVDLEAFSARVTEAEAAAKAARRVRRKA
jgi:transcription elongation factor Elf1